MRFIHTADWHLGRFFHGIHLTEDQAHVLEQLIALEEALGALLELRNAGRLVGVISHVPELRQRIQARLEVTPGPRGSRAAFVVP